MKNLTQQELNQVVGGYCPMPVFMSTASVGILGYILFETYTRQNYNFVGGLVSGAIGFAFGVIAWNTM